MSNGIVTVASIKSAKQTRRISKAIKMKLSLKQKLRRWLMDEEDYDLSSVNHIHEHHGFESEGMRFTVHKANGGFVIETRTFDRRKDESYNTIYVITEDKDLGVELGKIITMESMR
jgi:hypothetical protein